MSLQDRESVEDFDLRDEGSSPVRSATSPEGNPFGVFGFMGDDRPLTTEEHELARRMLEQGGPNARAFLPQLDRARVVSRCPCGWASIDLAVDGLPAPTGGIRILGDFLFGNDDDLCGVFIFERSGVLAGIEVYGLAGDAPRTLPAPHALRPFETSH